LLCGQRRIKSIVDSWLKVQAAWLYLQPIFGSQDIRNQIPKEGAMFEQVDEHWYDGLFTRNVTNIKQFKCSLWICSECFVW